MERQIKVVAWLLLVFGILLTVFCIGSGFMVLSLGRHVDASPGPAGDYFGVMGGVLLFYGIVVGIPGIAVGMGLLRMSSWSRIAGMVVSGLYLLSFNPLFIAIGIYGLVILSSRESLVLFQSPEMVSSSISSQQTPPRN